MNGRNVSLDLMEFVEQNILPRYNSFDKAHRLSHVNHVIKQSLELALKCGADINMAYAIAAYHDLGLEGPRAVSHTKRQDIDGRPPLAALVLSRAATHYERSRRRPSCFGVACSS